MFKMSIRIKSLIEVCTKLSSDEILEKGINALYCPIDEGPNIKKQPKEDVSKMSKRLWPNFSSKRLYGT